MARVGSQILGSVTGKQTAARNLWSTAQGGASTVSGRYNRPQYYGLLWHFYRNTVYIDDPSNDPFHVVKQYLLNQRLYPKQKGIYNPVARLTNAYVAAIVGGKLDPLAGDGTVRPTALPIITEHAKLREPISKVWGWSNLDIKKALVPRFGTATGNVGIRVIDDPARGQVRFEVVPPWEVTDIQLDAVDNVTLWQQEYPYEEEFFLGTRPTVVVRHFRLVITKDEFRTYRDGMPYGFEENNGQDTWPNPYGFVPALWIKHIDTGTDLGLCAYHNSIPTINTINETASHLAEQVKKSVHPQFFISGATEPKSGSFLAGLKVWWSPNDQAKAQVLNDRLDINGVVAAISDMYDELEKNHPLLNFYIVRSRIGSGDLTGKAVHTMLYDIEHDVNEAQMPYDSAWVRAHKMALSIGGFRGLPGFEGLDLEQSYRNGELDHTIGSRPLIPMDDEQELLMATTTGALLGTYIQAEKDSGLKSSALIEAVQEIEQQIRSGYPMAAVPDVSLLSDQMRTQAATPPPVPGAPPPPGGKPALPGSKPPVVSRSPNASRSTIGLP